jgi:hypothetical protein
MWLYWQPKARAVVGLQGQIPVNNTQDVLLELAEQSGIDIRSAHWARVYSFARLIVRECNRLNLKQSFELSGVITDTEHGSGFDSVCLDTVKRVEQYLASNAFAQHFGFESDTTKESTS